LGKNAAAWEETDPKEICRLEFSTKEGGLDREPSVYEVEVPAGTDPLGIVVQIHAEHFASFLETPPMRRVNVNIEGLFDGNIIRSTGDTQFRLTRDSHRHLEVTDEEQLVRLVELVRADFENRKHVVTRAHTLQFASDRYHANDPEWVEARSNGKVKKWKLPDPSSAGSEPGGYV
jgi:hypothetical protein